MNPIHTCRCATTQDTRACRCICSIRFFFSLDRFAHILFLHSFRAPAIAHTFRSWNMWRKRQHKKRLQTRKPRANIYRRWIFIWHEISLFYNKAINAPKRHTNSTTLGPGFVFAQTPMCSSTTFVLSPSPPNKRALHKFTYNYFVLKMTSGQFISLACNFFFISQSEHAFRSFFFLSSLLLSSSSTMSFTRLLLCHAGFRLLFLLSTESEMNHRVRISLNICRRCKRHHWDAWIYTFFNYRASVCFTIRLTFHYNDPTDVSQDQTDHEKKHRPRARKRSSLTFAYHPNQKGKSERERAREPIFSLHFSNQLCV